MEKDNCQTELVCSISPSLLAYAPEIYNGFCRLIDIPPKIELNR